MAKYKVGDRVVHPGHAEGPAGTGTVCEVCASGTAVAYRVAFDTGVRHPDGRHLEKVVAAPFPEDVLKPA
jgi:hypothetical protein